MVYCEVTVHEEKLRENLIQCVKILGGDPLVVADKVSVTTDKNEDKMVDLFEQFLNHSIRIVTS